MIFPFFTIFLLFLAWFTYNRLRAEKLEKEQEKRFWLKEEEANSVRKKDLSLLPYITISPDALPIGVFPTDELLCSYETQVQTLASLKILNLTGFSNTDLKLNYGAPNLTFLTECDPYLSIQRRETQVLKFLPADNGGKPLVNCFPPYIPQKDKICKTI